MKSTELANLLKLQPTVTKQNLSLVLSKQGKNLDYWVTKLLKEKFLIQLKNGLYISSYYLNLTNANLVDKNLYYEYLANVVKRPSYVSLEYVLGKCGFLAESTFAITSVTLKSTNTYNTEVGVFIYKSINPTLFKGFETFKFKKYSYYIATPSKALFDYFYFKEATYYSKEYLFTGGRFNWFVLSANDLTEFYGYINTSKSKKMVKLAKILKKQLII